MGDASRAQSPFTRRTNGSRARAFGKGEVKRRVFGFHAKLVKHCRFSIANCRFVSDRQLRQLQVQSQIENRQLKIGNDSGLSAAARLPRNAIDFQAVEWILELELVYCKPKPPCAKTLISCCLVPLRVVRASYGSDSQARDPRNYTKSNEATPIKGL